MLRPNFLKTSLFAPLCAALVAASCAPQAFGAVFTLLDGSSVHTESATLRNDNFLLDAGRTVPRSAVREIRFALGGPAQAAPAAVTDEGKVLFESAKPLLRRYPDAGALLLADEGDFLYKPDGTWTERQRIAIYVAKDSKKSAYGSVLAYQETGRTRAAITRADIYCPDGRTFRLDPSQVRKTAPQGGDEFFETAGEYLSYELRGLETGCIADYTTETETFNPHRRDFFFPSWYFQSDIPAAYSRVRITLPQDKPLRYAARNFGGFTGAEPVIASSGALKTYEWTIRDIPPVSAEPDMPAPGDIVPSLRASLLESWEPVYDWSTSLLQPRSQPSPELARFALELTRDASTHTEKAAIIYHFVQKNIRYVAVKAGVASFFGGYAADATWKRGWGCCIDKAILLTAMLGACGIQSYTAYLNDNTSETTQTAIPNLSFNHAITLALIDGKRVFLDSTGYDYRYPATADFNHGAPVVLPLLHELAQVPVPQPRQNGEFYDYKLSLSENDDAEISALVGYSGAQEAQLREYYRECKPDERKLALERFAKRLSPKAELTDWQVKDFDLLEKPFTISMELRAPGYAAKAGPLTVLTLPDLEMQPEELTEASLPERKYPVQHESSLGIYRNYEIKVPRGLETVALPQKLSVLDKHFSFLLNCEQDSPERISCRAEQERKSRLIPPEDYPLYKSALERAAALSRSRIFFRSAQ